MNPKIKILFICLILLGIFSLTSQGYAAKPIAKVSSFKGDVVVLSDVKIFTVTRIGQALMEGDRIQTKEGRAQITFNDGAVMKVRPFTSVRIEEREEKSGWWVFKTKKAVRRVTVFVGKLWFKTGASKRKNYLQTPTAVCGIRGTVLETGYDNAVSLLNVITGLVDKVGPWTEGPFANPGRLRALKNQVYNRVDHASRAMEKAKRSKNPVDLATAEVAALRVIIDAAEALKTNPDEKVREAAIEAAIKAQETMQTIIDSYPEAATTEPAPETTEPGPETTEPAPETTEPAPETTEPAPITTVPTITTVPLITTEPSTTTTTVPVTTTTVPATTTTTSTTTTVPATTTTTSTTTTIPATTTTIPVTTTTVPIS